MGNLSTAHTSRLRMKTWILVLLVGVASAQHAVPGDLEPLDDIDEKEFEEYFHLDPVDDPEEFEKRSKALKENEKEIKKINDEYENGDITWFDGMNEFADLTEDEFLEEKTGATSNITMGRGVLDPLPEERVDQESERYFEQLRLNRASVPSSYSSKRLGLVSPIKNQLQCGSCVSFSTIAAVETCFKKLTNVFGDYSEQQLVDCGYKKNNANGCNGAPPHAYAKWLGDNKIGLAHESQYPYLNQRPKLYCPANLPVYNQGARITGSYYTYSGDEELMKQLVYQHGAVISTIKSQGPFQDYKGGIFAGCPPGKSIDHAITVVGYGRERGVDYWLVKNSWGRNWGEQGYFRIKRGVNMCGIGRSMSVVKCSRSSAPTNRPLTTKKPCLDNYSNCKDLAKTSCYQPKIASSCAKSCGLCPGMRPARSYTCYNKYSNCASMRPYCHQTKIASGCKMACGKC